LVYLANDVCSGSMLTNFTEKRKKYSMTGKRCLLGFDADQFYREAKKILKDPQKVTKNDNDDARAMLINAISTDGDKALY
jgi:hypothetical protein